MKYILKGKTSVYLFERHALLINSMTKQLQSVYLIPLCVNLISSMIPRLDSARTIVSSAQPAKPTPQNFINV